MYICIYRDFTRPNRDLWFMIWPIGPIGLGGMALGDSHPVTSKNVLWVFHDWKCPYHFACKIHILKFIESQMWSKTLLLSLPFSLIAHTCCTFSLVGSDPQPSPAWTQFLRVKTSRLAGELRVVLSQKPVQTHTNAAKIPQIWRLLKVQDQSRIICLWEASNFSSNGCVWK